MLKRNFISVLLFPYLFLTCTDKQIPGSPALVGYIEGIVTKSNTTFPLNNVFISTIPATKQVYSDANGKFILEDIAPGEYNVFASIPGYDVDSLFVEVKTGDTSVVNFSLISFEEYFDYYPLDIGNYWEYGFESSGYSVEIIADTLISDMTYRIIVEKHISYRDIRYERLDSLTSLIYRYYPDWEYEVILDSLAAKTGQVFTNNMFIHPSLNRTGILLEVKEKNILGMSTNVRSIIYRDSFYPYYETAYGIGVNAIEFHRFPRLTLKYARIRGIEYGQSNKI